MELMESETIAFDSPVGPLMARSAGGFLTGLSFVRSRQAGGRSRHDAKDEIIAATRAQIGEYFAGRRRAFDIPFALEGPPFHRRVWMRLCAIPYGETISYGRLAKDIGEPDAARAVGAANGANPIVIIVPCHRVIGADGGLVGYGGGLRRKRTLLDLESGRLRLAL
jgi:methylated-DNA-[protein]-cysteine S-methyltransferase